MHRCVHLNKPVTDGELGYFDFVSLDQGSYVMRAAWEDWAGNSSDSYFDFEVTKKMLRLER